MDLRPKPRGRGHVLPVPGGLWSKGSRYAKGLEDAWERARGYAADPQMQPDAADAPKTRCQGRATELQTLGPNSATRIAATPSNRSQKCARLDMSTPKRNEPT